LWTKLEGHVGLFLQSPLVSRNGGCVVIGVFLPPFLPEPSNSDSRLNRGILSSSILMPVKSSLLRAIWSYFKSLRVTPSSLIRGSYHFSLFLLFLVRASLLRDIVFPARFLPEKTQSYPFGEFFSKTPLYPPSLMRTLHTVFLQPNPL